MLYCRIGNKDKNIGHATLHINTFSDLDYQLSDVKHINISIYKKNLEQNNLELILFVTIVYSYSSKFRFFF